MEVLSCGWDKLGLIEKVPFKQKLENMAVAK